MDEQRHRDLNQCLLYAFWDIERAGRERDLILLIEQAKSHGQHLGVGRTELIEFAFDTLRAAVTLAANARADDKRSESERWDG
jgi:hypothetical protein